MVRSRNVLVAAALALVFCINSPVHAKWPTTSWMILDEGGKKPDAGRQAIAEKHRDILEHASFWFQSMSFKAPYQLNDKKRVKFSGNEKYLAYLDPDASNMGSSHNSKGSMRLSTHPGFYNPLTVNDRLFQSASVHELFHGIQLAYPAYRAWASKPRLPGPPLCDTGERANAWLTEGTASAVQIQYLERQQGRNFRHAFYGSPDIRWVRAFDQSLDWGRIPAEHSVSHPAAPYSWQCSYGTWYFWYAVGNMLGSTDPRDPRRTAYLHFIFTQNGAWYGTGLEQVDAGLKQAAQELNALTPYRGGFFSLYPQFVAQYLDVDDFYEKVEQVVVTPPSVYESVVGLADPMESMAAWAWRVRVQMPPNTSSVPYTVRFVLDASDPDMKDALHLIVDDTVITRPEDPTLPYSQLRRVNRDRLDDDGGIEYFVRVANVARHAADTTSATFKLKVEVEGFYGETPATDTGIGAIPPGFEIKGPDAQWNCSGGDDARATYAFMTPDGLADQLERMLPQGLKNIETDLDSAEMQAQAYSDAELERIQRQRKRFERGFDSMIQNSDIESKVAQAAKESRHKTESQVLVKLSGQNEVGACDVLVILTLPGLPAAQRVPSENFSITITSQAMGDAMAAASSIAGQLDFSALESMDVEQMVRMAQQFESSMRAIDIPKMEWHRCSSGESDCDDGEFALGEATHEHLYGEFNFQVHRGDRYVAAGTGKPSREYADVAGFINITSSKNEVDNNLLDFLSRKGGAGDLLHIPGLEHFLQGGTMFGK